MFLEIIDDFFPKSNIETKDNYLKDLFIYLLKQSTFTWAQYPDCEKLSPERPAAPVTWVKELVYVVSHPIQVQVYF